MRIRNVWMVAAILCTVFAMTAIPASASIQHDCDFPEGVHEGEPDGGGCTNTAGLGSSGTSGECQHIAPLFWTHTFCDTSGGVLGCTAQGQIHCSDGSKRSYTVTCYGSANNTHVETEKDDAFCSGDGGGGNLDICNCSMNEAGCVASW